MKKLYPVFLLIAILCNKNILHAQSILNPNDSVYNYDPNNPPVQPPPGQIGKWVRTPILDWNTNSYKAYIYKNCPFRLKFPKTYNPNANDGKKYPILVFFHGYGEHGTTIYDNEYQLYHGGDVFENAVDSGKFDGYVLCMQSLGFWGPGQYQYITEIVDYMVANNKVDPFRVTVNGLSAGGQASWEMLINHPNYVAAALPMSSCAIYYKENSTVNVVKFTPMWYFQGGLDGNPDPNTAHQVRDAIWNAGGNFTYTEYPDRGHATWVDAWVEPNFFPYLLAAYQSNPWTLYGRTSFCNNITFSDTLGLASGFDGYQWRKNGVVMSGATSNTIVVNSIGTYDARVLRGSIWSDWSHTPVVISNNAVTVTPPIHVSGVMSDAIPAPDKNYVNLEVPDSGYISYTWKKVGSDSVIGTDRILTVTQPGDYIVSVVKQYYCSSTYSPVFTVIDANGSHPPDPATSLTASTISNTKIQLNWSNNPKPKYNETAFEIYRSNTSNSSYSYIGQTGADTLTYSDLNLTPNTTYYYKVRAINLTGAAALTDEVSSKTLTDTIPPSAPSNVQVTSYNNTSVGLSWTAATDNIAISRYDVFVNGVKTTTSTTTSVVVSGLQSQQVYNFYVKAEDRSGNLSPQSNLVSSPAVLHGLHYNYYQGIWDSLPDFSSLTATKSGYTANTDLTLRARDARYGFLWEGFIKVPVAGTYKFETYSDDGSELWLAPYNTLNTPLVNNNGVHNAAYASGTVTLQAGTYPITVAYFQKANNQVMKLYWTCSALYGDNNRHLITDDYFSDNYTAADIAPAAPSNLAASALDYNKIKLSWTDNSNNESGFEIYRSTISNGTYQIIATTGANVTSFTDSGVAASTPYYYKIQSINNYGHSGIGGVDYNYYRGLFSAAPGFATLSPTESGHISNFSLSPANRASDFALDYLGKINIATTGTYTFYTRSADGSKLYIDGTDESNLVVNNDGVHSAVEKSGTISLSKGTHIIYVSYFQSTNDSTLRVSYQGPNITKQVIPDSALDVPNVTATSKALPPPPALPTNLKATAKSSSQINLSWTDNATNETAYQVNGSAGDAFHFKLLATLPANSKAYTDSNLYAHLTYYYKLTVVGAGGASATTATFSTKTKDNAPVFTDVVNQTAHYGITTTIPVIASDPDGDSLKYTIQNKPAFAKLVVNPDNTASLVVNPSSSQQGTYSNIRIIANDLKGAKDTTTFTLTVNSNYDPVIDSVADYTVTEGGSLTINLSANDSNSSDVLNWSVSGVPASYTFTPSNRTAVLNLHPTYATAGHYIVQINVNDGNGGFAVRTFNLTVTDKNPAPTVYMRFKDADNIGSPWNNITGLTTTGLQDNLGNKTPMGLSLQGTWYATSNGGPNTGNNSGVYPDAVLKDYYYFGYNGGPSTVTASVTGLDTSLRYSFTFYAGSNFTGVSDNGTTTYTIGSQTVSLYVQNNTQHTVSINGVKPAANGTVTFTMAKASGTPVGYLNALVISSVYDDGTKPMAPSAFSAVATGTGVNLSWKDNAYNESSFTIYRATSLNGSYTSIGTVGSNITAYTDSSAAGNTAYFYKVNAVNAYGASPYSNTINVVTPDKIPVITPISDVILKNNAQFTVTVKTTDDAGDHVTLTAAALPPFVTFTDNGNGTATLLLKPTAGTSGFFPNVTITATDKSDSSASASFNITVTDNTFSSSVYLNFSDGSLAPAPWNNLSGWPFAGTTFTNLTDDNNAASGLTVTLVNGFEGVVAAGMRPGNGQTVYPDAVVRTAEFESSTTTRTIRISGLSAAKKYNFVFFNSHEDGLNGTTNFTINGQTVTLNATYNINKTVQINGISPDANGQVNISVAKASGADYAYISSIIIQAYSGSPLNGPSDLRVTAHNRTSVSLQWADRSTSETGFEIWRADNANGTYAYLATVPANTVSYTDGSLTPDHTYYYTVRAVSGSTYSAYSNAAAAYTLAYALYVNFSDVNLAPAPWNNTDAPPQQGYTWNNFLDEQGYASGISMTDMSDFAGMYADGHSTGSNSGIFPDNVIIESYGLFAGETGVIKLSGLNINMQYDLTFFASSNAYGDVNGAYTVNGKTVILDASLNTTGTVTLYGLVPDDNGELTISLTPAEVASQFGLIGALIVQGHTPSALSVPPPPSQQLQHIIASNNNKTQATEKGLNTNDIKASVFPNPFTQSFNLSLYLPQTDDVLIQIFDLNGKQLYQQKYYNIQKGATVLQVKAGSNFSAGIYIVKLSYLNEKASQSVKITKQ